MSVFKKIFSMLPPCLILAFAAQTASAVTLGLMANTSVPEGGLVASINEGWITDNATGQKVEVTVYINEWNPGTPYTITAGGTAQNNTDYCFYPENGSKNCNTSSYTRTIPRGSRQEVLIIETVPDFCDEGGDETIGLTLTSNGNNISNGSLTIVVEEDDDAAYIGQRSSHPYGGRWRSNVLENHPCP